jgi:radical SAM superfamily enzyme YgiQ (UPF0313 family)
MKISLVLCPFWDTKYPPLNIAFLSSLLQKKGFSVDKVDLNMLCYIKCDDEYRHFWNISSNILLDKIVIDKFISKNEALIDSAIAKTAKSQIVGFTIYKTTKHISLAVARKIKEKYPDKIIIFGGPECFIGGNPGEFLKDESVNYVVTGEGERVLPELINKIRHNRNIDSCKGVMYKKDGQLKYTGDRLPLKNLNSLPFPDFSGLTKLYKGQSVILPIQASRGCINRCAFCSEGVYWKKFRSMSGRRVFNEIEEQVEKYGADQFAFHDSLINGNMKELVIFCDLMIKNKLNLILHKNNSAALSSNFSDILWGGQALVRPEMTIEILKKMKRAGCYRLSYGIESGSQKVLNAMNKRFTLKEALNVLRNTHNAGIIVQMNIIIGFPTETKDDFRQTMEFIKEARPYIDVISPSPSCEIIKGTILCNCYKKFGVKDGSNRYYWESCSGENNYIERFKRYEKFCEYAISIGIPQDIELFRTRPHKWLLLSKYYAQKNSKRKALQCLNKYAKTKSGKILKSDIDLSCLITAKSKDNIK